MKYCIHLIVENLVQVSKGTAESYLQINVVQDNNFEIMSFNSYEDAEVFMKKDIIGHIFGLKVKGYEIRPFTFMTLRPSYKDFYEE
jgi:hypothetical protein